MALRPAGVALPPTNPSALHRPHPAPSATVDRPCTNMAAEGIAEAQADRAMGCVLGAFIGDAAGGPLEFLGRAPTEQEVR
jgi:hypothetical protein